MKIQNIIVVLAVLLMPVSLYASDVKVGITKNISSIDVIHQGKTVVIERIQDTEHMLTGGFAKTSRPCPPFCFQPMVVSPGVKTVGEVEFMRFMQTKHKTGAGLLVDARLPSWFNNGTIPGAINVPFTVFDTVKEPEALAKAFETFGVKNLRNDRDMFDQVDDYFTSLFSDAEEKETWDFSQAKDLLLFCNGPWCGQSPRAIKQLISIGYPKQKLRYYRGGIQMWQLGGFTTVIPEQ